MKIIIFLANILIVTLVSCSGGNHKPEVKVKNIILMIGDGMGVAQVYAAYTANNGKLNLEKARFIGFSKTSSADNYITDSGAGATAIATGQKTNNESIGIDAQERARKTILESAEENGLATGLLVTCPITHATPAAFFAHQFDRIQNEDIAKELLHCGIDIFIGGGRNYFEKRTDSINYSDSLTHEGYSIVYAIDSINLNNPSKVGCFTADEDMPPIFEGRGDYLPRATHIALEKLDKNKKGFFIMIEGSQIDWGGHNNDVGFVTSEVIDFDRAIGVAYAYADQNPGTLVIVTADHETGGMAITGGDIKTGTVEAGFSTIGHTATMVPVYAYGTNAEEFAGIYENTEIFNKMMRLLGLNK